MVHKVKVPRLNANEDEILVADVIVAENTEVMEGDELFVVETSKAAVSVESEVCGYVRKLFVEIGKMVKVGSLACIISNTADEPLPEEEPEEADSKDSAVTRKTTAKERLRAKKKRESKSEGSYQETKNDTPAAQSAVVSSSDLDWVRDARLEIEKLNTDVRKSDLDKLEGFLPDDATMRPIALFIGDNIQIGKGSIITARKLYIGSDVTIAANTLIEADTLYLGDCAKIGENTKISTIECIVSNGVFVGDNVEVDLSGGRSAESRLLLGPASLVSPRSFVNTCREVVLETESALSPGVMVFTHRFWQSVFDGYDTLFAGVRLCPKSWVGGGCHVLPGAVIGEGAIVMSNSTVVEPIPPFTFVGGVPAKVLRKNIKRNLSPVEKDHIMRGILSEFIDLLVFKNCLVKELPQTDAYLVSLPDGSERTLIFLPDDCSSQAPAIPDRSIVLSFGQDLPAIGQMSFFNLSSNLFSGVEDRLTHEVRNFLRRQGIHFQPYGWDANYKHGL